MKTILKTGWLIVLLLSLSIKVEACWPNSPLDWYGDPDDDSWTSGSSGGSGSSGNLPVSVFAGNISQDQNYIITATPYKAVSGGVLDNSNSNITIQYYDGLGRPVEQVQAGITPNHNDLATYQEYDAFGRESNSWLPAVVSGNNGAFIAFETYKSKSADTYNNVNNNVAADASPYAYPVYEPSPLNRVLQQFGPGADWQKNDKAVSTGYQTNSGTSGELSCALFTITGTGVNIKLNKNNFYSDAQLYVTKTTDEDGNTGYEFKDKLGQVVLKRQILSGTNVDTYYVYDDFGNLCFVLPPMASEELIKTNNTAFDDVNNTQIKQYAYIYKYDSRNRCIWKKLPGCEPVYYIYDNADRLIFTQDGENRKTGVWQFAIPDVFGRIVLTGICNIWFDYAGNTLKNIVVKAERSNENNTYKGYTTPTGVNLFSPAILTVNYYDDYKFLGSNGIPNDANTQYNVEDGHNDRYTDSYKGLLTGTLTAQLMSDGTVYPTYLYSVMYYDYKGRLIQTKSNNHLYGGIEKEYIVYNFAGQPTGKKHIHSATGKPTQTEGYGYQYDNAGRLKTEMHQLNNGQITTIAYNAYDELGRLKANMKGGLPVLNITYSYNIRSWMKLITGSLFTEGLYYNESYCGSDKQYNGNLSAMRWKVPNENIRGYAFAYNNLSWLTNANYIENDMANNHYNTSYYYDNQGNIQTLQRYGKKTASAYGLIDSLKASYTGNRLLRIWDVAGNVNLAESADFKEYANEDIEYTYNANGAMTQDLNKGISEIQYNLLNLPELIVINSPVARAINGYEYSASGAKLRVVQRWDPFLSTSPVSASDYYNTSPVMLKTTDYAGNMIYENGTLKRILIDGGYIEGGQYYYYLTDHLGNNRLVVNSGGAVVQKNHYYPFGMSFAETSVAEQGKQPYKYGGKELDQMNGLNLYDNLARLYDPAFPRTLTPDPLCEKYYPISPYAWCANNPVLNVDRDGRDWYRHDESGAVIWQEGDAASITVQDQDYNNIGETYSETFGNATYNYTQNNLGSITYTGITDNDWVSQITTKINCYQASSQMLSNVGVTTAGRGSEVIVVNQGDNGRAGTGNDNLNNGISVVNTALENGNPIIVGVDYKNGSPNADGMTDHFIVVSSMTQTVSNGNVTGTTYNFFDPGTSNSTWGTSSNNTLSVSNNQITGTYVNKPTQPYTVVTVRRNQ